MAVLGWVRAFSSDYLTTPPPLRAAGENERGGSGEGRVLCWGHPHRFNYGWPLCVLSKPAWPKRLLATNDLCGPEPSRHPCPPAQSFQPDLCLRRGQPAHPPRIGFVRAPAAPIFLIQLLVNKCFAPIPIWLRSALFSAS